MLDALKQIFGFGPKVDYGELIKQGALILDVRSKNEFAGGHIKGSVNIPVNQLEGQLKKMDKNRIIITCCASGMRSASAKAMLQANGFKQVHNAMSWTNLLKYSK